MSEKARAGMGYSWTGAIPFAAREKHHCVWLDMLE